MTTELFYKLPQALTRRRDLTCSDKVILSIIGDRIGRNSKAWPGFRRLAKDAGIDDKTAERSVARLEEKGLLHIERRGRGRTHHYTLPDESAPKMGAPPKRNRPQNGGSGAPKKGAKPDRPIEPD